MSSHVKTRLRRVERNVSSDARARLLALSVKTRLRRVERYSRKGDREMLLIS